MDDGKSDLLVVEGCDGDGRDEQQEQHGESEH